MSAYPVSIDSVSMTNEHMRKAYHLTVVANARKQAILIRRFGAIGRFGEVTVQKFDSVDKAFAAMGLSIGEKNDIGYATKNGAKTKSVDDPGKLASSIGRLLFPKLTADQVNHIDPDFDTRDFRKEPEKPRYTEDGEFIGDTPKTFSKEELRKAEEDARAQEERRTRDIYSSNPLFGAF